VRAVRAFARLVGGLAVAAAVTAMVAGLVGFRINLTNSVPAGIYRVVAAPVARGALVSVCLDPTNTAVREAIARHYFPEGPCPGRLLPFLKYVEAVGGDTVVLGDAGVSVNGQAVPNTAAVKVDWVGRPIARAARGTYHLSATQVLLLATHRPGSFDGRYIGPSETSSIQAVLKPIWLI